MTFCVEPVPADEYPSIPVGPTDILYVIRNLDDLGAVVFTTAPDHVPDTLWAPSRDGATTALIITGIDTKDDIEGLMQIFSHACPIHRVGYIVVDASVSFHVRDLW